MIEYFIRRTDERFDRVENKLDQLYKFRWQVIGGAAAVSAIVGLAVSFMRFL